MIVITLLVIVSILYFYAVPFLAYLAVSGAVINHDNSNWPLVLFIGFPGVVLAVLWWIGLRLTRKNLHVD
jgi:hypothetical protein